MTDGTPTFVSRLWRSPSSVLQDGVFHYRLRLGPYQVDVRLPPGWDRDPDLYVPEDFGGDAEACSMFDFYWAVYSWIWLGWRRRKTEKLDKYWTWTGAPSDDEFKVFHPGTARQRHGTPSSTQVSFQGDAHEGWLVTGPDGIARVLPWDWDQYPAPHLDTIFGEKAEAAIAHSFGWALQQHRFRGWKRRYLAKTGLCALREGALVLPRTAGGWVDEEWGGVVLPDGWDDDYFMPLKSEKGTGGDFEWAFIQWHEDAMQTKSLLKYSKNNV